MNDSLNIARGAQRCSICKARRQPLTQNGLLSRCVDESACNRRAHASQQIQFRTCIYCKVTDQPLIGDGLRKRCGDERACAARVRAQQNPHVSAVPSNRAQQQSSTQDQTTAEALISLMQARANLHQRTGPFVLSETLALIIQAAQARFVQFGKPGSGKSNSSTVTAENCLLNNIPVMLIDLLGNLWGIRADGDKPGLPLPIIGGPHADLAVTADDAEMLAEIFSQGVSMLLDLSELTRDDQQMFVATLCKTLLRVLRRPAHVIFEEAETVCPAFSRSKTQFAAQGAVTLFARQIRNFGVGWTFSTQRPQLLHPDIIDASSAFLAMQSTGGNAQRAIKNEAESRVGKIIASAILSELGRLAIGEAWLLPDPNWLGEDVSAPMKIRLRKRYTYDSTAVPMIGSPTPPAPKLVPVDLRPFARLRSAPIPPSVKSKRLGVVQRNANTSPAA